MRDTDRLMTDSDVEENAAKGGGWGKVRELKRQSTSTLASLIDSPRKIIGDAPSAHSYVRYDPEAWGPSMRASLADVGSFVLAPCFIVTVFTALLTLLAKVSVDAEHRDSSHFAKHAPQWVQLPPFAHTVLGGALSFLMVFRTNTAYSRWWEARLMWGQVTIACRSMASQSVAMFGSEDARRALFSELILFTLVLKNGLREDKTMRAECGPMRPCPLCFSLQDLTSLRGLTVPPCRPTPPSG